MNDQDDFFDIEPSAAHLQEIQRTVKTELEANRQTRRRQLFVWFSVPALASLAALVFWRNQSPTMSPLMTQWSLWPEIEVEEDVDFYSNLETLENLDLLEEWNGSEDA